MTPYLTPVLCLLRSGSLQDKDTNIHPIIACFKNLCQISKVSNCKNIALQMRAHVYTTSQLK